MNEFESFSKMENPFFLPLSLVSAHPISPFSLSLFLLFPRPKSPLPPAQFPAQTATLSCPSLSPTHRPRPSGLPSTSRRAELGLGRVRPRPAASRLSAHAKNPRPPISNVPPEPLYLFRRLVAANPSRHRRWSLPSSGRHRFAAPSLPRLHKSHPELRITVRSFAGHFPLPSRSSSHTQARWSSRSADRRCTPCPAAWTSRGCPRWFRHLPRMLPDPTPSRTEPLSAQTPSPAKLRPSAAVCRPSAAIRRSLPPRAVRF